MTFFLTGVFMMLVFWRPQEWLVPWLYGWPLLDVIVVISLFSFMIELNEGRVRLNREETPQLFLLLGLWFSAPMSHVAHTYYVGMVESITPVFKICFFTVLLLTVMDRVSRLRMVALIIVAMACTMAAHAMMQIRFGRGFAGVPPLWVPPIGSAPAYYRSQFFGIFADPNDMAQFFVSAVPFCFVLARRYTAFGNLLGVGLAWFLLSAMSTTHSRGGVVGLAGLIGTAVVSLLPARWFPRLLALGLLGALALCPFSGKVLDMSAHDRVVFWGLANNVFKHNPLFGIGYEMFWQVTAGSRAAHNAFVSCYTELGVFGYWFWFGLIQVGIVGAWRARMALARATDPDALWLRRFATLAIIAMVGFCGAAYFLSRTFVFPLFFLIAILGVVPRIARQYLPADHPPFLTFRKDVLMMVTVGTTVSVVYVYISIILLNKAFYG